MNGDVQYQNIKAHLHSFLLISCSPVFYKSFIATYSNGYVLDADKKVKSN